MKSTHCKTHHDTSLKKKKKMLEDMFIYFHVFGENVIDLFSLIRKMSLVVIRRCCGQCEAV